MQLNKRIRYQSINPDTDITNTLNTQQQQRKYWKCNTTNWQCSEESKESKENSINISQNYTIGDNISNLESLSNANFDNKNQCTEKCNSLGMITNTLIPEFMSYLPNQDISQFVITNRRFPKYHPNFNISMYPESMKDERENESKIKKSLGPPHYNRILTQNYQFQEMLKLLEDTKSNQLDDVSAFDNLRLFIEPEEEIEKVNKKIHTLQNVSRNLFVISLLVRGDLLNNIYERYFYKKFNTISISSWNMLLSKISDNILKILYIPNWLEEGEWGDFDNDKSTIVNQLMKLALEIINVLNLRKIEPFYVLKLFLDFDKNFAIVNLKLPDNFDILSEIQTIFTKYRDELVNNIFHLPPNSLSSAWESLTYINELYENENSSFSGDDADLSKNINFNFYVINKMTETFIIRLISLIENDQPFQLNDNDNRVDIWDVLNSKILPLPFENWKNIFKYFGIWDDITDSLNIKKLDNFWITLFFVKLLSEFEDDERRGEEKNNIIIESYYSFEPFSRFLDPYGNGDIFLEMLAHYSLSSNHEEKKNKNEIDDQYITLDTILERFRPMGEKLFEIWMEIIIRNIFKNQPSKENITFLQNLVNNDQFGTHDDKIMTMKIIKKSQEIKRSIQDLMNNSIIL